MKNEPKQTIEHSERSEPLGLDHDWIPIKPKVSQPAKRPPIYLSRDRPFTPRPLTTQRGRDKIIPHSSLTTERTKKPDPKCVCIHVHPRPFVANSDSREFT